MPVDPLRPRFAVNLPVDLAEKVKEPAAKERRSVASWFKCREIQSMNLKVGSHNTFFIGFRLFVSELEFGSGEPPSPRRVPCRLIE